MKKTFLIAALTLTQIQSPTHAMEEMPKLTAEQQAGFEKFADLWRDFKNKTELEQESHNQAINNALRNVFQFLLKQVSIEDLDLNQGTDEKLHKLYQESLEQFCGDHSFLTAYVQLFLLKQDNLERFNKTVEKTINEVLQENDLTESDALETMAQRLQKLISFIQQAFAENKFSIAQFLLQHEDDEQCRDYLAQIEELDQKNINYLEKIKEDTKNRKRPFDSLQEIQSEAQQDLLSYIELANQYLDASKNSRNKFLIRIVRKRVQESYDAIIKQNVFLGNENESYEDDEQPRAKKSRF